MSFKDAYLKPFLQKCLGKNEGRAFSFKGLPSEIGGEIERWVAEFLTKKSFEILELNYSIPQGEIDIIAMEKKEVVFIEVKASHDNQRAYFPEEKVTVSKIARLEKAASAWLQSHPDICESRFDVIAVHYSSCGVTDLKHYRNALEF